MECHRKRRHETRDERERKHQDRGVGRFHIDESKRAWRRQYRTRDDVRKR
jgi:hypothetical protein